MKDRKQHVSVADHSSSTKVINVGVPQGSLLGAILFLIHINDLPKISNLFTSILYAGDTTLLTNHTNYDALINSIHNETPSLQEWINANRLSLNLGKTRAMLYSNPSDIDPTLDISFNSAAIEFKSH